jgi:hypothetical protein
MSAPIHKESVAPTKAMESPPAKTVESPPAKTVAADYRFLEELGWSKRIVHTNKYNYRSKGLFGIEQYETKWTAPLWHSQTDALGQVRAKHQELTPAQLQALREIAHGGLYHSNTQFYAKELLKNPPRPGSVENLKAQFDWRGDHSIWYKQTDFLEQIGKSGISLSDEQVDFIRSLTKSKEPHVGGYAEALLKSLNK